MALDFSRLFGTRTDSPQVFLPLDDAEIAKEPSAVLQVDTPSGLKWSGLLNIVGWAYTGDPKSPVGRLDYNLDGTRWNRITWRFPQLTAPLPTEITSRASFRFAINTHQLTNGPHELWFRLYNDRGREVRRNIFKFTANNKGFLAALVREELERSGASPVILGPIESNLFPKNSMRKRHEAWFDAPDALTRVPAQVKKYGLPKEFEDHFTQFINEGYFTLENYLTPSEVHAINQDVDQAIASGEVKYAPLSGDRIELMFRRSSAVRRLWQDRLILLALTALYDDQAMACQTLNYLHGSGQYMHQDSIHLTPFPEGYMCGVWVALEDIHPDSGPLAVYPRSHKLRTVYSDDLGIARQVPTDWAAFEKAYIPKIKQMIADHNLEPHYYTPKAGSVLVWHANLIHGGSERRNRELSRKSMVSHYFAQGAIAYYDSSGHPGNTELD